MLVGHEKLVFLAYGISVICVGVESGNNEWMNKWLNELINE
jgi:hypothetical protein